MHVNPTKLCQIEIYVSNLDHSLSFYENVFGWKRMPLEIQDYYVLNVPESCPFGLSLIPAKTSQPKSSHNVLYFKVEDPEKIMEQAPKFHGRTRFGPKKVPGYGVIYQLEDPDGQRYGLFNKA